VNGGREAEGQKLVRSCSAVGSLHKLGWCGSLSCRVQAACEDVYVKGGGDDQAAGQQALFWHALLLLLLLLLLLPTPPTCTGADLMLPPVRMPPMASRARCTSDFSPVPLKRFSSCQNLRRGV
jgi:hypothetical protein